MEKLSVIESALMLSIKIHPNNHAVFHARAVSATVLEIDRAVSALKRLNYVIQDNSGRLTLNEHSIKRANTDLMHSEQKPVVHRVAETSPAILPVMKTEIAHVNLSGKPTPESILAQLTIQANKGMTAGDMAKHYGGYDGRSLVQLLRKMKTDGQVTKFGNMWYAATPEDKVETIAVPFETRRTVTNVDELQRLIKLQKGWFTAKESHDELTKAFIVDWSFFYGVFMDMATEGEFNVRENGVLVSYEMSIDGDNSHSNCLWDFEAEEFNKIVQDYIYLMGQGGTHRWNLSHCVEITKIRSDLLLHWFELAGFDVENIQSIGPKVVAGFRPFDELDSVLVQEFIGAEGCRVTAFMKAFNLDPDTTEKVCSLLKLVNIAHYDVENKFLMLPQTKTIVEAPEEPAPRVTNDPETGEETIQMIQEPSEGFIFFEVCCDPSRSVATQYQYGSSPFNGMPITPTDDPEVFLLQVPEAFKFESVDVEGMYEHVRHDSLNIMPSSHSRGHHISKHFEDRAAAQQEEPPERIYFNGERPNSATLGPSPKVKSFIDGILGKLKEHLPPAGPTGPVGPSDAGLCFTTEKVTEHSSMLQINRPLVGMHLFRISEHALAEMKPLPETVEDVSSPYFGCKITACDGDQIGYATVTVEPGHPMWQHVVGRSILRDHAYERTGDDAMAIDADEDEDIFGAGADPLTMTDEEPEAEEYAANLEPHLKHLLKSLAGVPTKEQIYDMIQANSEGVGKPANGTCCPLPVRTVKPEWTSGLAIIADQHKRSSSTYKLLMEIKEYLEK